MMTTMTTTMMMMFFLKFLVKNNIESSDSDIKKCCSGKYKKLSGIKYSSWQTKL